MVMWSSPHPQDGGMPHSSLWRAEAGVRRGGVHPIASIFATKVVEGALKKIVVPTQESNAEKGTLLCSKDFIITIGNFIGVIDSFNTGL